MKQQAGIRTGFFRDSRLGLGDFALSEPRYPGWLDSGFVIVGSFSLCGCMWKHNLLLYRELLVYGREGFVIWGASNLWTVRFSFFSLHGYLETQYMGI